MSANTSINPLQSMSPVHDGKGGYFVAGYKTVISTFSISPNQFTGQRFMQFSPFISFLLIACLSVLIIALVNITIQIKFMSTFKNWQRPKVQGKWSFLMGNLIEMQKGNPGEIQMKWTEEYGGAVVYRGLAGNERLLLSDPRALMYVLHQRCYAFPKPTGARSALSNLLGEGVLTTEGDVHKRQRKIVNPTFTQSAIRDFLPLFWRHSRALATHLQDSMEQERNAKMQNKTLKRLSLAHELSPAYFNDETINQNEVKLPDDKMKINDQAKVPSVIDVLHWTSRTTLDVIGESAFSYKLNSLQRGENGDVIADSFNKMMTHVGQLTILERAQLHFEQFSIFDGFRPLPTSFNKRARACYNAVESVAQKMLKERRQGIAPPETEKDVLERVLRANEDSSVKQNQRLMPHEIMGQLTTLILAGHETTSTALTWALYELSMHPLIQENVRKEILEAQQINQQEGKEDFTYEELHSLPLLNNITNEVMRLNPPVHSTNREASEDDIIPLKYPIKGEYGQTIDQIPIRKGQAIIVHVATYNRRKDLWGPDADQFRPDRWENLPEKILQSGVPGYSLSFLAGPRNCVGQKFALTEFKAILSTLLSTFSFAPPPGTTKIDSKQVIVTRPRIRGMESQGTQMPLCVTPLQ